MPGVQGHRDGACTGRSGGRRGEPADPPPGRSGERDEGHDVALPGYVRAIHGRPRDPAVSGTDAGAPHGRPGDAPAPGGADAPPGRPARGTTELDRYPAVAGLAGAVVLCFIGVFQYGIGAVCSRWRIACSWVVVSFLFVTAVSSSGFSFAMRFVRNWASVIGGFFAAA